jgi:lysyl endopeptidase
MKQRDMSAAPSPTNISLGAPLASQSAAGRMSNETKSSDHMGKPLQIGFGRDVAQTSTAAATQQVLKWKTTASGSQVAAINFNSTGAKGMRVGLLVDKLPETAILRFYSKGSATAFEVKGETVLAVLAKNLAAGDKTDEGRTYWSPVIKANNGTLEIEIPAGLAITAVQVSIPLISHFFMSMSEAQSVAAQSTYDGNNPNRTGNNSTQACQVDVNCSTPRPEASDAVAWLVYNQSGGYANICSGTLLNDSKSTGTPYILTANHCISTQPFASTLYAEFKYRSLTCNNAVTGEYFPLATTGALLLHTAYDTDTTLLRLYGTPTNVLFAGWDAAIPPATSTAVHGIHHPQGDQQRLMRGSIASYFTRSGNSLTPSDISSGTILGVAQSSGNTEPGSSGSGLFKEGPDSKPILIGQLYGRVADNYPTNSCSDAVEKRLYGRFDLAYKSGMNVWLNPEAVAASLIRQPVFRFYVPQSGVYFYTIYASERDTILATLSNVFTYEGIAFYASPTPTAGYDPIFRFRNTRNGSYLYTISSVERDSILQSYPQYVLEGTAWYAQKGAVGDGSPLYRFRTNNGTHIYTAYESEKASILANYPGFVLEGPAYYVKLTP